MDNCIGIQNRRFYLIFLASISLLLIVSIYPLSLLEHTSNASVSLRLVTSSQLIGATFGAILCLIYTLFAWYAALTGMYQVDTYSSLLARENPRRKL